MRIAACAEHLGNAVSLHGMWLRGALPAQNVSECCLMRGGEYGLFCLRRTARKHCLLYGCRSEAMDFGRMRSVLPQSGKRTGGFCLYFGFFVV